MNPMLPIILSVFLQMQRQPVRMAFDYDIVTEVWSSTNLVDWTLKTNVPTTVYFEVPNNGASEFFKVRRK